MRHPITDVRVDNRHDTRFASPVLGGGGGSFLEKLIINAAFSTVRARELLSTVINTKIEEDSTSSLGTRCINYRMSLVGLPRTVQIPAKAS